MIGGGNKLVCIGCGTIGSYFVLLMARSGLFSCIVVIDPDVYQPHNLASQSIDTQDLGRLKVQVIRNHIRRINPALRVEVIAEAVERVPLGRLRGTLIVTGVDNLAARRFVSRVAWRLGMWWIDAGVRAEGRLVRIDTYLPGPGNACMECGLNDRDRTELDWVYLCSPNHPVPTGSPAYLGHLAASLLGKECARLLEVGTGFMPGGQQILMDTGNDRCIRSIRRSASDCPFDHRTWSVRPLRRSPGATSLRRVFRLVPWSGGENPRLRLHGDAFVHRLVCPECGFTRRTLHLAGRIDSGLRRCTQCASAMVAPGIDITDSLTLEGLAGAPPRLSLYALGFRKGDIFSVENTSGDAHFEIGGPE